MLGLTPLGAFHTVLSLMPATSGWQYGSRSAGSEDRLHNWSQAPTSLAAATR
jgi:hypothetical protein